MGDSLEKITWSESFSVGVQQMDEQHLKIIGMINTLIEAKRLNVDRDVVTSTLNNMMEYAITHFEDEEQLLAASGYPDSESDEQEVEHSQFMEKTSSMYEATDIDSLGLPDELLTYLRHWWVSHILDKDMKYKRFFADKE